MRTKSWAGALLGILGVMTIAAISQAFSTVLVTDEAGMRALAHSVHRASIRGKVASISTKYYGDHRHDVYLHFEGSKTLSLSPSLRLMHSKMTTALI
jgi:hypothetical protein